MLVKIWAHLNKTHFHNHKWGSGWVGKNMFSPLVLKVGWDMTSHWIS